MTEEGEKQEELKDIEQYITMKLYSVPYVNDKGYRIGNYHIVIDKKNLPFSDFDQVDHFLINLFKYAKEVPNNKMPTKKFNEKFFKNHPKKVVLFKPIKYRKQTKEEADAEASAKENKPSESTGGRKSLGRKKRKTKSRKNRTRKNR
jgi:hypothetical protein